jgi:ATP-dependent 26S proteasome regulatory subunit
VAVEALVKGKGCEGYSGADLRGLLQEGGRHAREAGKKVIGLEDLEFASTVVKCSVRDPSAYRGMKERSR